MQLWYKDIEKQYANFAPYILVTKGHIIHMIIS